MLSRRGARRLLTAIAVACVAAVTLAAEGASAVTISRRAAVFDGQMKTDKRSGDTDPGTCNEVVTSGAAAGTIQCYLSFELNKSICNIEANALAGEAHYVSFENTPAPFNRPNIQLYGVGEAGSGVIAGYHVDFTTPAVFRVTIDASDTCGATDLLTNLGGDGGGAPKASKFTGHAEYY